MKSGASASESSLKRMSQRGGRSGTIAVFSRSVKKGGTEMRAFWRQVKHELLGRDATLILAVTAGFIAWNVTYLLRIIFS